MVAKNAMDKLKGKIATTYQSSFDFGAYGIDEESKNIVVENESIARVQLEKAAETDYKICAALYKISMALKKDGVFGAWCDHVKLHKDKVSERLRRYELYMQFPDKVNFIFELPIKSVLLLTRKQTSLEQMYDAVENGLTQTKEIRQFLELEDKTISEAEVIIDSNGDDSVIEAVVVTQADKYQRSDFEEDFFEKMIPKIKFPENIKTSIKRKDSASELEKKKRELASLKRQIAEIEKSIEERLEELSLKNQNPLFVNEDGRVPIDNLDLSIGTLNFLKKNNISTLEHLSALKNHDGFHFGSSEIDMPIKVRNELEEWFSK